MLRRAGRGELTFDGRKLVGKRTVAGRRRAAPAWLDPRGRRPVAARRSRRRRAPAAIATAGDARRRAGASAVARRRAARRARGRRSRRSKTLRAAPIWSSTTELRARRRLSSSDTRMTRGRGGADDDASRPPTTVFADPSLIRPLTRLMRPPPPPSLAAAASPSPRCTCTRATKTASAAGTGGTLIVAATGRRVDRFSAARRRATGAPVSDLVFDHLAEIGERADDRSATRLSRRGSPRAGRGRPTRCRSCSRSIRAPLARRQAGDAPRTCATASSVVHRSEGRRRRSRRCSRTSTPSRCKRLAHRGGLVQEAHAGAVLRVAYQLYIVPEHIYGSIPLEQLRTSAVDAHADRERASFGSCSGSRTRIRARRRHGELPRPPEARSRDLHAAPRTSTRRTQMLTGQADFMQSFPGELVGRSTAARSRVRSSFRASSTRSWGSISIAPEVEHCSRIRSSATFASVARCRWPSIASTCCATCSATKGASRTVPSRCLVGRRTAPCSCPRTTPRPRSALLDSAGWRRRPATGCAPRMARRSGSRLVDAGDQRVRA